MATLDQLNLMTAAIAAGDLIWLRDMSDSADPDKRLTADKLGLVGFANTYTAAQTFAAGLTVAPTSVALNAFDINLPAGASANALRLLLDGGLRIYATVQPARNSLVFQDFDNGAGEGSWLQIGRNNNASTPAAGALSLSLRSAGQNHLWVDAGGLLRIAASRPTNATDGGGTVVGSQTSAAAFKELRQELSSLEEVRLRVIQGAGAVQRFVYKAPVGQDEEGNEVQGEAPYGGEEFEGVVVDQVPAYGLDRDEEHPGGKSLNTVVILGDLLRLAADLAGRMQRLEDRLEAQVAGS